MKKILLVFILMIVLNCLDVFAQEVLINRDLSNLNAGEEFEVFLEIVVKENLVALGIEEGVPFGAEIINCSWENSKIYNNKLEILLFDSDDFVKSKNISYVVKLNSFNDSFNLNYNIVKDETTNVDSTENSQTSSKSSSVGGSGGSHKKSVENYSRKNLDNSSVNEFNLENISYEFFKENSETSQNYFRITGNSVLRIFKSENSKKFGLVITGVFCLIFFILKKKNFNFKKIKLF